METNLYRRCRKLDGRVGSVRTVLWIGLYGNNYREKDFEN